MALIFMGFSISSKEVVLLAFMFCWLNLMMTSADVVLGVEFEVGGKQGWATPNSKDSQFYNEWASKNRFLVNDTLHFQYQKDSVLEVTNDEYEKCKSSHPIFFSNNGDTEFKLDRPGLFYFISGVSGHCERGLKMIIKVREPPVNATLATAPPPKKNGALHMEGAVSSITLAMVMSFFGAFFA